MNVQNTEAWNVFTERSEQGVSAVPAILDGGLPPSRSGTAWRTVLWVVLHVRSRPWVVSGGVYMQVYN